MIFEDPAAKAKFLNLVSAAREKYRFQLENFTLMGNHFHMLIRPREGTSLSRILQWILSAFARYWNKIHGYTGQGAVWGQRFFSKILGTLVEYLHTFVYIDRNPVVAGLVLEPEDWPFGGPGLARNALSPFKLDDAPPELLGR